MFEFLYAVSAYSKNDCIVVACGDTIDVSSNAYYDLENFVKGKHRDETLRL